jgi:hypothetical protein
MNYHSIAPRSGGGLSLPESLAKVLNIAFSAGFQ